MHEPDKQDFCERLDELARTFGREKPDDDLLESYWQALKDVELPVFQRCVVHHLRYGKFFPKPFELRPREEANAPKDDTAAKARFEAAVAYNRETWRLLKAENPQRYELLWREACLARLEVTLDKADPRFEEVRRMANDLALQKLRAWEARRAELRAKDAA